jgi:hypothetical protein
LEISALGVAVTSHMTKRNGTLYADVPGEAVIVTVMVCQFDSGRRNAFELIRIFGESITRESLATKTQ